MQHLPHAFHALTAATTLLIELLLVWAAFLPRRFRLVLFAVVTSLQIGIIVTANYAFLNYLVLLLGVLLVDDVAVRRSLVRLTLCVGAGSRSSLEAVEPHNELLRRLKHRARRLLQRFNRSLAAAGSEANTIALESIQPAFYANPRRPAIFRLRAFLPKTRMGFLAIVFYATLLQFPLVSAQDLPAVLKWPAVFLEPFRFANGYGLFAVMTRQRFEIEFQGTLDGETYIPYPFRYKPQNPKQPPGIYAPYQPRFEWNLWFASLSNLNRNRWVLRAAAGLLRAEPDVLNLRMLNPILRKAKYSWRGQTSGGQASA